MAPPMTSCPGCGLRLRKNHLRNEGYYNASAECLAIYQEVLGTEFGHLMLFARAHQLTVDAYALQHAGAYHRDKSVCVHLVGLYLAFEQGMRPRDIAPYLQRLASRVRDWPHFEPPPYVGPLTILDVARVEPEQHVETVTTWADQLWRAWQLYHDAAAELAEIACAAH